MHFPTFFKTDGTSMHWPHRNFPLALEILLQSPMLLSTVIATRQKWLAYIDTTECRIKGIKRYRACDIFIRQMAQMETGLTDELISDRAAVMACSKNVDVTHAFLILARI